MRTAVVAVAAILTHLGLDTDDAGARPPPRQLDLISLPLQAASRGPDGRLVCHALVE